MADEYRDPRVPQDIIDYWERRSGLNLYSFSYKDIFGEEHAHGFAVAKAMTADVLDDIKGEAGRAIRDGTTFTEFKKQLTPRLQARGWWGEKEMTDPLTGERKLVQLGSPRRLKTIYWANIRSARAAGAWERAQRTKRMLPYFLYGLGPSRVHRDQHRAMEGTIATVDDPIWDTWFPPSAWGCKCWVRQITATEAQARGIRPPPDLPTKTWTNDRTGEQITLPQGVDPGWHHNPGKARSVALVREVRDKLQRRTQEGDAVALPQVIGRVARSKMVTARNLKAARNARRAELLAEGLSKHDVGRRLEEELPLPRDLFAIGVLAKSVLRVSPVTDDILVTDVATLAKRGQRLIPDDVVTDLPSLWLHGTWYGYPGEDRYLVRGRLGRDQTDYVAIVKGRPGSPSLKVVTLYAPRPGYVAGQIEKHNLRRL